MNPNDIETRLRASLQEWTSTTPLANPDHPRQNHTGAGPLPPPDVRSSVPRPRARVLLGAVVVVVVVAGFGVALAYGPHSAMPGGSRPASGGGTVPVRPGGKVDATYDPPMLEGAGIRHLPGMTEVTSTSTSLGLNSSDVGSLSALYTPTDNLSQVWVSSAAVTQYGTENEGLPLPLPVSFARQHPGADEVTVTINQLSDASLARTLLANPMFNDSSDPQFTTLDKGRFDGGVALKDDIAPNNVADMNSYTLVWAERDYLVRLDVQGYSATVGEADRVATLVVLPRRARTTKDVALPSDGWKPGDGSLLALAFGPFHAVMTAEGPCAWLGATRSSFLWPAGYRVRFHPTELINAQGRVVATEGQKIDFGGGWGPSPAGSSCAATDQQTWSVESLPVHPGRN